ncbi:NAD(P)H-quinone oxidoreductase subunit 4L, chloroplastic [uncultured archaeon]|nr:NAD(P)H-quinone oxidoreductase subunit 4L, chloroplastic [uncultured archaeon]
MLNYVALTAIALFGVAVAALTTNRHFVMIMLAIELIFISSTLLLVSFFAAGSTATGDPATMLVAIWSVAAAEVIAAVTFYVFMRSKGMDFDITKLSRMKW